MRNPFRSEVEAFHFLLLTIAAFAAIAAASLLGGPWAGVPTLAVVTGAAAFFYLSRGQAERPVRTAPAHVGAEDERRILVVANETLTEVSLVEQIERAGAGYRKLYPTRTVDASCYASAVRASRLPRDRSRDTRPL